MKRNNIWLITFLLFILGTCFFSKFLISKDVKLLSLDQPGERGWVDFSKGKEMMRGDTVKIKFIAKYNNIGTISVRFTNHNRDSNDILDFKLFDNTSNKLIYQAKYKTDQFLQDRLFPFGFPAQENSKNREYTVEIQSLSGVSGKGVYIDATDPIFVIQSVYTKSYLVGNMPFLFTILKSKVNFVLASSEFKTAFMVYFSPLFLYLMGAIMSEMSFSYSLIPFCFASFLLLFVPPVLGDYFICSLIFYWISISKNFDFENKITGTVALVFLFISSFFSLLSKEIVVNTSLSLFFALTFYYLVLNTFGSKEKLSKLSLSKFLRNFHLFDYDHRDLPSRLTIIFLKLIYFSSILSIFYRSAESYIRSFLNLIHFERIIINEIFIVTFFFVSTLCSSYLLYRMVRFKKTSLYVYIGLFLLVIVYQNATNTFMGNFTKKTLLPTIFQISPTVTDEAWVDVSVVGRNFGQQPFVGMVTINGVPQIVNREYWTDKKISFRTDPSVTKSGEVCIHTVTKGISNCHYFNYNFGKK